MSRALLINPSSLTSYGAPAGGTAYPYYPVLGLASMAGAVIGRGHEVEILDLSYLPYDPDQLASVLRRVRPDVVGVTATTPLANQLRDISYLVAEHAPGAVCIGGGSHPSALPELTLRQSALDLVAVGEADFVIADLLDGRDPGTVPNLVRRVGERITSTPQAALLHDLDDLPFPAWDHYPTALTPRMSRVIARYQPVATMEFSRGCLFKCDFCASKLTMGLGYRKKSPERCAEEMVRMGRLGFREVILTDDIFTSDADWAASVCEEIIRRQPGVAWTCSNGIRVDSTERDLFRLLERAGCYRVCFGFESGSDEVLAAFGKGGRATLDQGLAAVEEARRAGLEPDGLFMVGLSADTPSTMRATMDYARRARLDVVKCGICVPFPGTPYFHDLHEAGRIRTYDWDEYSVWNNGERIYEHPTLTWEQISDAFDEFYTRLYWRNPGLLWRRLRFAIRNRELLSNLRFTLDGWRSMRRSRPEPNRYAYEHLWRPLDASPDEPLPRRLPMRASLAVSPEGRKGRVVLRGRPRTEARRESA